MPERHIYLIEAENGLLKIGSSEAPESRYKAFAAYAMCAVRLIAKWPGEIGDELALHKRFAGQRSYNEWFRIEGDLAEFAEAHRGLNTPEIPDWRDMSPSTALDRRKAAALKRSATLRQMWADPVWRAEQLKWLAGMRKRDRKPEARA
jgi:hypothetical protein